ncbi:sugar phosphate isomerase/epimerase [Microbacterium sp. 18062]|uniref:sugar phosphate isomerase/epimerase family protein n=1 Tax=Microbacterium sp. 18062 TaxID=2681410 RepID=UPI001359A5E1|nr:sugar phosphate isomerase/epimerase [Microbacterium sp. 18062]
MTTPQLSVQLYSVDDQLAEDLDGTLRRLAGLGLRQVEAFDFVRRASELRTALDRHGLVARTGHATFLSDELRFGDSVVAVPPRAETFSAARELGLSIVIDAFVPPARWADAAEIERTASLLNAAAAEAAEHGLRVGYHNHAHEFAHEFDGRSGYELLVGRLDEAVVLELDAYWAAVAGQDVPALLGRLGDRVRAVHVKDGPLPQEDPLSSGAPFDPAALGQQPAGRGEVPLGLILDAAVAIEYAVIEFDHYGGDVFDGIAQSIAYLRERGIRR